jgi:hypothetical protein
LTSREQEHASVEVGNLFALLRKTGDRKVLLKEGGYTALNCVISVQGMSDFLLSLNGNQTILIKGEINGKKNRNLPV